MDMYQKREERVKKKLENNDEKVLSKAQINWYPGHMAKTKKQIIEDLKLIDVVVEILDARIPNSSSNPDIQQYIKDKKKVIALNKSDLADEKENKKWINYFKSMEIPAVLTDSNSGNGINEIIREIERVAQEDKDKYIQKGRIGKSIRVMIIGIPNVGKSSFINRITKKSSTIVGNKPGVTRQKQWIRVKENIELLDTPGILWPKLDQEKVALNLAYTGTIKDDIIDSTEIAFNLLKYLLENNKEDLIQRYKLSNEEIDQILENDEVPENENIWEIMKKIGIKRGTILSGGIIDEEKISKILIDDFRTNKLGKITFEKA